MAQPPVADLPVAPVRGNDQATFNQRGRDFLSALEPWRVAVNDLTAWTEGEATIIGQVKSDVKTLQSEAEALRDDTQTIKETADSEIGAIVDESQSLVDNTALTNNFVGQWSNQSGSLAVGKSVLHNGVYWIAVVDIADVTASEPAASNGDWAVASERPTSGGDIGDIVFSPLDLEATGSYLLADGRVFLQSARPELFAIYGIGQKPVPTSDVTAAPTLSADGLSVDFDPGDQFMVVLQQNAPYRQIFETTSGSFGSVTSPTPNGSEPDASFAVDDVDGTFLAVVEGSGNVLLLEYNGSDFVLADSSNTMSSPSRVTFDATATYIAVADLDPDYLGIYKRSGSTISKLANPSTLPGNSANDVAFSSDATYLVVAEGFPRHITIYKRSGDTFTKLSAPAQPPDSTQQACAFSPDDELLVTGGGGSETLIVYERSGDTFTKISAVTDYPSLATSLAWRSDGKYLVVGSAQSPHLAIYERDEINNLTKIPDPETVPSGAVNAVALGNSDDLLAVAHDGGDGLIVYEPVYPFDPQTEFRIPNVPNLTQTTINGWAPPQVRPYIRSGV
ncbi:hypothetical protein SLPG_00037 [Salicola phage CGphi29]|uniref:hypothetical protein n=1 Tax=Salicola phage CGphi29 TaxID=754067 RepID=UPI0002C0C117|nr:hypothetical protein SLPG_00037 [Salicola phage CGphi29]AGH31831.1 hypothetical protein SLPG_00037 [Salicola phage CGphi29]